MWASAPARWVITADRVKGQKDDVGKGLKTYGFSSRAKTREIRGLHKYGQPRRIGSVV